MLRILMVTAPETLSRGDDVDATHVGQEPEHVVDIGILEIEIDTAARVALRALLPEHGGHEAAGLRGAWVRSLSVAS